MGAYRPTARTDVARQRKDLDALFDRASQVEDVVLQADLSRYIYVRLVGFLEQACSAGGRCLMQAKSSGRPQLFGLSFLDKSFNPTVPKLLAYVERFDVGWRSDLETLLGHDEKSQSINSLVGLRNDIAHGKNQGASLSTAREYRRIVDEVVDFLLDRFDP